MSEAFIPLISPDSAPTPAPPAVFAAHAPPTPAAVVPVAPAPARVTLQREGDQVSHIAVHCGCGQTIELDCVYEGASR